MPNTTFAQRFTEPVKVSERKAITNGTNIMTTAAKISSGVICMPASTPALISCIAPGSKIAATNVIKNATVQKSHNTEILIFQSSTVVTALFTGFAYTWPAYLALSSF